MENDFLMIGQLAKIMNVTVRTLQYYDKEGLLKPSALSEGGRRLYSSEDVVKLHQILSMKSLGFSLDEIREMLTNLNTPAQVAATLKRQNILVENRILELQKVTELIANLHDEVLRIDNVDFEKYAVIITLLRLNNDYQWVMEVLDHELIEHTVQRFAEKPELAIGILDTYNIVLDEAVALNDAGESPQSERSITLAKKWWDMVVKFTGGDMSLLPKLMEFDDDKSGWNEQVAQKQKQVDGYIGEALMHYFAQNNISVPEMEENS